VQIATAAATTLFTLYSDNPEDYPEDGGALKTLDEIYRQIDLQTLMGHLQRREQRPPLFQSDVGAILYALALSVVYTNLSGALPRRGVHHGM